MSFLHGKHNIISWVSISILRNVSKWSAPPIFQGLLGFLGSQKLIYVLPGEFHTPLCLGLPLVKNRPNNEKLAPLPADNGPLYWICHCINIFRADCRLNGKMVSRNRAPSHNIPNSHLPLGCTGKIRYALRMSVASQALSLTALLTVMYF